jgi:protein TonB
MPRFPGGQVGFTKFLLKNLKYPDQQVFQGSIVCSFIIESNGNLTNPEIYNKARSDYSVIDKEMLRVIEMSPKWQPGLCRNKKVPVRMIVPIKF